MNSTFEYQALVTACELARRASQEDLIALAVERGCGHYAPLVRGHKVPSELLGIAHEVLACALLRFPMPEGFDAFRCGVMALSDLGNHPDNIGRASEHLGVWDQLGHVVRIALRHDDQPEFWRGLLPFCGTRLLPNLPGPSRFISETRLSGSHRGPVRTWLRTAYRP